MNLVTQPIRGRAVLGSAVAVLTALVALVALAPTASAAGNPIAGGMTTIELGKGFDRKLKKNGVKLQGLIPTQLAGRTIALPIAGGELDPATGAGVVAQAGGFKFKRGKRTAPVRELVLETSTGLLVAKVAGKPMRFARVAGLSVARNGFGFDIAAPKLQLTGFAAQAINKRLGFTGKKGKKGQKRKKKNARRHERGSRRAAISKRRRGKGRKGGRRAAKPPFRGGFPIGRGMSASQPAIVNLVPTGVASLLANEEDLQPFAAAEVKPVMVAPASMTEDAPPALLFPILGGAVAPNGVAGIVQTGGAVVFGQEPEGGVQIGVAFGGITIDLATKTATAEVAVESNDPEKAPTPGKLGRGLIAHLDLSAAAIAPDPATRTIAVSNVRTPITADLASLLNGAYKKEAFKAGDSLGTFSFVLQAQ